MQLCVNHFIGLKDALKTRGLMEFVPKTEEELRTALELNLVTTTPKGADFDPLMGSILSIYSNAVRCGGIYLLMAKPDGSFYCPLCELESHTETKGQEWIDSAANAELVTARDEGRFTQATLQ